MAAQWSENPNKQGKDPKERKQADWTEEGVCLVFRALIAKKWGFSKDKKVQKGKTLKAVVAELNNRKDLEALFGLGQLSDTQVKGKVDRLVAEARRIATPGYNKSLFEGEKPKSAYLVENYCAHVDTREGEKKGDKAKDAARKKRFGKTEHTFNFGNNRTVKPKEDEDEDVVLSSSSSPSSSSSSSSHAAPFTPARHACAGFDSDDEDEEDEEQGYYDEADVYGESGPAARGMEKTVSQTAATMNDKKRAGEEKSMKKKQAKAAKKAAQAANEDEADDASLKFMFDSMREASGARAAKDDAAQTKVAEAQVKSEAAQARTDAFQTAMLAAQQQVGSSMALLATSMAQRHP
mmetsp:Transcript_58940/g.118352  ORF Transcript_58940/g.118352 Transcript_58940/m.118352 type:complete len:350 (+) Transcript_58940:98-1147(+)